MGEINLGDEPNDSKVNNVKYYPKDIQLHTVDGKVLPYPVHGHRVCGKCGKVIPQLKYADHFALCLGDVE